jgi:hypothetical protein
MSGPHGQDPSLIIDACAVSVLPEKIATTSAIAAVVDKLTDTLGVAQFSVEVTVNDVQLGNPVQA